MVYYIILYFHSKCLHPFSEVYVERLYIVESMHWTMQCRVAPSCVCPCGLMHISYQAQRIGIGSVSPIPA